MHSARKTWPDLRAASCLPRRQLDNSARDELDHPPAAVRLSAYSRPEPEYVGEPAARHETRASGEIACTCRGLRYRVDYPVFVDGLRIRPDMAFTARRLAVFIDGCFWHCCPQHGSQPASNAGYWAPKLRANVERDRRQTALLGSAGWTVLRFWEHTPPQKAAEAIILAARRTRSSGPAR